MGKRPGFGSLQCCCRDGWGGIYFLVGLRRRRAQEAPGTQDQVCKRG